MHIGFENCPTVIPYYGGKWELSKQLVPMLPDHSRYIEVFAGGLSMLFRKKRVERNIILMNLVIIYTGFQDQENYSKIFNQRYCQLNLK